MKPIFSVAVFLLPLMFSNATTAETPSISPKHYQQVIFEDDFSADKLDKRWGMYKSASTVRDGVMVGITPEDADHPSVNTIRIKPQADLEVSLSFKFAGSKNFQVMYRDRNCHSSHAGHICHVAVTPKFLTMYDGKTGIFRKDIRQARKEKRKLDDSIVEMLKTKSSRHRIDLDPLRWHRMVIRIQNDVMETFVDGKFIGAFQSEGLAHPTKDQVNLTTGQREMLYDDFQIKGVSGI